MIVHVPEPKQPDPNDRIAALIFGAEAALKKVSLFPEADREAAWPNFIELRSWTAKLIKELHFIAALKASETEMGVTKRDAVIELLRETRLSRSTVTGVRRTIKCCAVLGLSESETDDVLGYLDFSDDLVAEAKQKK